MSAEVDQASALEPRKIEMSTKNTSSSASSTSGPKASIFAAKSGFVIPKNKLSGSLIPIFKGGKKPGGNDAAADEIANQVMRKSKWGPDPSQDAAVRRGRAMAYQTRIDQITQQLVSGILEETQSPQAAEQPANSNLSSQQIDFKVSEMLKMERREVIGEILKLNPSFKTPPDYEPLLKEETVSIPVKDHAGYNFVGLIFGPGSETQKRLEKETKAKIQVFGTKANTGEKVEISASNASDMEAAYKELNVHVSADTFEKVDAAVALIELLVNSVLENLAAGNNQDAVNQHNPSGEQGLVGPAQTPLHGQFQFQGPSLLGDSAQASAQHLSLGFNLAQNSGLVHNNSLPVHSSPLDLSFYGSRPISVAGFSSMPPGTSFVHSRPQMQTQVSSYPYPPRNFHMSVSQPPLPIIASQPPLSLPVGAGPLVMSSLPLSGSGVPPGPQSDRPLSSSGWPAVPSSVSASFGPGSATPQSGFVLSTPPSAGITVSFSSSSVINVPVNHHTGALSFTSAPAPQVGSSPRTVMAVSHAPINYVPGTVPNSTLMTAASQPTGVRGSFPGNTDNPTPIRPPMTVSKLPDSGLVDFTFKLHPPPPRNPPPNPRAINQSINEENAPLRPLLQPPSSQAPPFRLGVPTPNLMPSPGMHGFLRSQVNQMGQNQAHGSGASFAGTSLLSRSPGFPNGSTIVPSPIRNFNGIPQRPDLARPLPPMPGNNHPLNYPSPITPLSRISAPNQQQSSTNRLFASNPGAGAGGGQIYDPFSPT